jgi:hypothetical protein
MLFSVLVACRIVLVIFASGYLGSLFCVMGGLGGLMLRLTLALAADIKFLSQFKCRTTF